MAGGVGYAKARPVFEQYKASKYSRKFLAEHEGEIALYRAATAQFETLLGGAKLPKMDKLKAEWQELTAKKKAVYKEYRAARSTMQEVLTVKANIDALLGDTRQEKNKEQERQRMDGKGAKRRHNFGDRGPRKVADFVGRGGATERCRLRAKLARSCVAQFVTTRPEVIPGLGLAPTSRFSQKIATVATVALLAV